MKQASYRLSCTTLLLLLCTLSIRAQLNPSINVRDKYIVDNYQLSQAQVNAYNKVLSSIAIKWQKLKNTKSSVKGRAASEKQLSSEFCTSVKPIFLDVQYTKWHASHKGNLSVRFYKEDLGMTGKQFTEFRKIFNTYSNEKKNIRNQGLSATKETERRLTAFNQYSSALHKLFPEKLADYLVYENQVLNQAANLSANYTVISENQAIRYAILKMQYDKDKEQLAAQTLKPKLMKQQRQDLQDKYEASLRSFLTNEEYIACSRKRDNLTDQRFIHAYKMSAAQLSQYKVLKKKLAMKELQIKQSKIEKAAKAIKLQEAQSDFETQLKKVLTVQQFDKWKKDKTVKQSKRKDKIKV